MTARDPDTWRKYAYPLGMWLNFLAARSVSWDGAVPEDVEAFKFWRMADERNPCRVAPGTVGGEPDRAQRLPPVGRYPVRHRQPGSYPAGPRPGTHRQGDLEQIAASPAGVRRADVKWFTPGGYRRWRDAGLCGFGLDGLEDAGWRGRNEQRDRAFADDLFETGLRHRDLAEQFQARVRAAGGDPPPVADLKAQISQLTEDNARLRADNAEHKAVTSFYAHIINELSAELEQVAAERDQLLGNVRAITAAPSLRARPLDQQDP